MEVQEYTAEYWVKYKENENMKVEVNKGAEILKKSQTEMKLVIKTLIIVKKNSLDSLANRARHC